MEAAAKTDGGCMLSRARAEDGARERARHEGVTGVGDAAQRAALVLQTSTWGSTPGRWMQGRARALCVGALRGCERGCGKSRRSGVTNTGEMTCRSGGGARGLLHVDEQVTLEDELALFVLL